MKILFIGDYSNLHACLGAEMKRLGHSVTIISDGCGHMHTNRDIHLERQSGLNGGFRYLMRLLELLPALKGYDVVQLINANFLNLRPGKIKYFFDRIKDQNGHMFLTLAGDDHFFVKACADGKTFRFSEFMIGDKSTEFNLRNPGRMKGWLSDVNRRWSEYLYEKIDGAMSVLPEYDIAARPVIGDKLVFTNIPVDLSSLPWQELRVDEKLRIFVGIRSGMEIQKGTARLLAIAKDLERNLPKKIEVECVRDLTLKDYLLKMRQSHIVLDQLYSYSPATNALQAMAMGRVAASGAQPEYYTYINAHASRPLICLSPFDNDLKDILQTFAEDPTPLTFMGEESRRLVETHNDVQKVAQRFINHWINIAKS